MSTSTKTITVATYIYDVLTAPAIRIIHYGSERNFMSLCLIGFGIMLLITAICFLLYVGMWCFALLTPITIGWATSVWVHPAEGGARILAGFMVTGAFLALWAFLIWSTSEIEVTYE